MPDTATSDRSLVTLLPIVLRPDPKRTVVRPFVPSDPDAYAVPGHPRGQRIVERLLSLSEREVHLELERVRLSLNERHRDVLPMLERRFNDIAGMIPADRTVTPEQRVLIGAYFSAEYSFESAALFNPSIVPHPAPDAGTGDLRFLFSLRGIGEGHLSSVTFRTGTWAADGAVTIDEPSETAVPPVQELPNGWADTETIQLNCSGSRDPSETVLFPIVESQSRGIEDLRLTPFALPDDPHTYAGTFTALGTAGVQQQLLQTDDFRVFKMHPVKGKLAESKGMALFPRQVDGRYLALGRQDNENLWLFASDDLFQWDEVSKLMGPRYPWEFVQIGNCGSPLEIDEGWLVLTHGVGVVRNYCMGAALLDRDDPTKVIGRMAVPLLEPEPADRDGYVPNVVYSCGGLVRGRALLLPYGVADEYTAFATVDLDRLVAAMVPG